MTATCMSPPQLKARIPGVSKTVVVLWPIVVGLGSWLLTQELRSQATHLRQDDQQKRIDAMEAFIAENRREFSDVKVILARLEERLKNR